MKSLSPCNRWTQLEESLGRECHKVPILWEKNTFKKIHPSTGWGGRLWIWSFNEESSANIMSLDSLRYKHGNGVTVITGKGPSMKRVTAPSPSAVARFQLKVSHDVIAASHSHLSKPGRLRSEISCRWEGIWPPVILSHLHPYRRRAVTGCHR